MEPYYAYFDFDTGMLSSDNIIECSIIDNYGSIPHISYDGNIIVEVLSQEINESKVKLTLPDFDACSSVILTYNNWIKTINIYSSYGNDKYAISSYTPNKAINLIESISEDVLSSRMESIYVVTPDVDSIDDTNQNNRSSSMYGYLRWTDDQLNVHSLIGIKVELTCKNIFGNVVAQYYTYSNNIGYYQFDTSGLIFNWYEIHVIFMNDMISVNNSDDNVYDIKIKEGAIVYDVSIDLDIYDFDTTHSDYYYKYAQVFCAMYNYSNYAKELNNNVNIPMCKIIYPTYTDPVNPNNNDDGAYYVNSENTIHLGYDDQQEPGSIKVYASWDVIGHEYGHHLQKHFFFHSGGGNHDSSRSDILTYLINNNIQSPISNNNLDIAKEKGCTLAFKESWPTFFAISAQDTFSNDLKQINSVADSIYQAYNFFPNSYYDLKDNDFLNGESCERTIMYLLYRLWDYDNDVSWDNITISENYLWYLMCEYNPKNLSEFVNYLYFDDLINVNKNDFGKILETLHLSAYNLSINQTNNYAINPTFSWNEGNIDIRYQSNVYDYSNNKFTIHFYDMNNNLILSVNNISNNSYTLQENEWHQILIYNNDNSFKVLIEAYATLGNITGPYYSQYYTFNKPQYFDYNIQISNNNNFEKAFAIQDGTSCTINLEFSRSGNQLIQTFGNDDVLMQLYQSDGVTLISSSDNEGYADNSLIYAYLYSNTMYKLVVSLYNQNISKIVKLSIIPTNSYLDNNASTITDYEDIFNINSSQYTSSNLILTQYNSIVLTWKPTQTNYYTISLSSSFDNFLYVINPTSNEYLRLDIDYNDDEYYYDDDDYELNAKLSLYHANADVTYLIVITRFDISLPIVNGNIELNIWIGA